MILPLVLLLSGPARAQPAANAAGSIVRSKEWIVRRGKSREEEFIGDVHYDAAGTKLTADWALYRQGPNDWQARGHIYARKEFAAGDVVETSGENAWYDENTLKGRLEPARGARVPLLRTPPEGGPDHAEGDHLSWAGETVGILSGRARGWGPRGEFWADVASYSRALPAQSLDMSGSRPRIHRYSGGQDAALLADRIVATDSPRRADATGRARGWILYQSSPTPSGANAFRCGEGDRSTAPGPDARVSELLSPSAAARSSVEDARFWEAESAAFSARACPWGPRIEFRADEARYARSAAGTSLVLNGSRPVVHDFSGDNDAALIADEVSAFDSPRRAVVTGRAMGWLLSESSSTEKGAAAARCVRGGRVKGPDAQVSALLFPPEGASQADEQSRFWKAEAAAYAAKDCPWQSRAEFWADKVDYEELPDRRVTLSGGRPVLRKIDDLVNPADDHSLAIKADQIVAYGSSRRIVAAGGVQGWMVFIKNQKRRSDKKERKKSPEKSK